MDALYTILSISAIVLVIIAIVMINKKIKHKRSCCPSCKNTYSYPQDFKIIASPLKWERKTKTETKGDIKYEIEYLEYYRIVTFDFHCSKCGHERWFNKRFNLYRSDSANSQSAQEELDLLKTMIGAQFDKEVFADKEIDIYLADD